MSLKQALITEYRMACNCLNASIGEFGEGVNALLLEKRKAVWKHKSPQEVSPQEVERFFGQVENSVCGELDLDAIDAGLGVK